MKILAFDSSAKSASVAILEDEKILAESFTNVGLTHSKTLLKMFEDLSKQTNISLLDIDLIATSNGPGSYTGVRIGVSVVQGLALSQNKKCVGVSTLEALAYNASFVKDKIICVVMDARASTVYNAMFSSDGSKITRLCQDRVIEITDLKAEIDPNKEYILVGDFANACFDIFNLANVTKICEKLMHGQASSVAMSALNHESHYACDLFPSYLK